MIGGIREDHEASGFKWPDYMRERCGMCGRFVSPNGPGVSWSQNWSTGWGGVPDLHAPAFRCSPCTDTHGIAESNCNPAAGPWSGRNPVVSSGPNLADAHSKSPAPFSQSERIAVLCPHAPTYDAGLKEALDVAREYVVDGLSAQDQKRRDVEGYPGLMKREQGRLDEVRADLALVDRIRASLATDAEG